jgi:hypothetical protein
MLINESILYPFDGRYFVVLNKQLKNGNKIEYEYDQKGSVSFHVTPVPKVYPIPSHPIWHVLNLSLIPFP